MRESKVEDILGYDIITVFKVNDINDVVNVCKSHGVNQGKLFNDFNDEIYLSLNYNKTFGLSQGAIFVSVYNVTGDNVGILSSKLEMTNVFQRCSFELKANEKYAIIHTSLYSSYINTWLTSR
jgi:hypothetical protein